MRYYSTNHDSPKVSFREAMIRSEAVDGGLYLPERLPIIPKALLNNLSDMSINDISYVISNQFLGSDLPSSELKNIGDAAISFPFPLRRIEPGIYALELFHGPTMTVKDVGALYMAGILKTLHRNSDHQLNIIVSTTGNSGNAIANTFHNKADVNVFVLYPTSARGSQIDQINSYGGNVHAIEVRGHLDECTALMSRAILDEELNETRMLTSANSFNIGNLMPYTIMYFHAMAQVLKQGERNKDIYMSVPTGSGGNLLAGYMAMKMGLPAKRLIAACNGNANFATFIERGFECVKYNTRRTYTPSMDTPRTPNMPRFVDLSGGKLDELRSVVTAYTTSDAEIAATINDVYRNTGYMLEPHSAAAYISLKQKMPKESAGVFMATAHPLRSLAMMHRVNDGSLELPAHARKRDRATQAEFKIPASYYAFKKILKYFGLSNVIQNRV